MTSISAQIANDIAEIRAYLPVSKRILTFAETCKYLGYSKSYLYKLTSAGIVPFSKPNGKKLFFDREKLDEWMLSNASSSANEKTQKAATYVAMGK